MAKTQIDRLALRLTGSSNYASEHLARLVAERLAALNPPFGATLGAIRLRVTDDGTGIEQVADRIVAGLVRELGRSV